MSYVNMFVLKDAYLIFGIFSVPDKHPQVIITFWHF